MKPVTTGPGISGSFTDDLVAVIFDLRNQTKDQRWRLYIQGSGTEEYAVRVYAPDLRTEVHMVAKALNMVENIREILVSAGKAWQSRVQAAAA